MSKPNKGQISKKGKKLKPWFGKGETVTGENHVGV